jgi:hypothetical protein
VSMRESPRLAWVAASGNLYPPTPFPSEGKGGPERASALVIDMRSVSIPFPSEGKGLGIGVARNGYLFAACFPAKYPPTRPRRLERPL